jgi:hypothetical protein
MGSEKCRPFDLSTGNSEEAILGAVRWPTVGTGAITGLGFNWIYERAEPNFTILFWEKIAPFSPEKFTYKSKQQNGLRP